MREAVLLAVLRGHLIRRVYRLEWQVEEKWLGGEIVLVDQPAGLLCVTKGAVSARRWVGTVFVGAVEPPFGSRATELHEGGVGSGVRDRVPPEIEPAAEARVGIIVLSAGIVAVKGAEAAVGGCVRPFVEPEVPFANLSIGCIFLCKKHINSRGI